MSPEIRAVLQASIDMTPDPQLLELLEESGIDPGDVRLCHPNRFCFAAFNVLIPSRDDAYLFLKIRAAFPGSPR